MRTCGKTGVYLMLYGRCRQAFGSGHKRCTWRISSVVVMQGESMNSNMNSISQRGVIGMKTQMKWMVMSALLAGTFIGGGKQ